MSSLPLLQVCNLPCLSHTIWTDALGFVVAITLIPGGRSVLGRAAYLAPITTVFGHPGRRFGVMAESLILTVGGMVAGLAWSLFGIYLSSLILHSNPSAAYAIRGLFLAIALLLHGFLRSHTPRLFLFVLLLIIVSVVLLTSPAMQVTGLLATQIAYPILVATGVILLVNVSIFPEFSSAFMGQTTIETLSEIAATLRDAGGYFIREGEDDSPSSIKDKEALPDETDHEHPRETGHTPGPSAQCHEGHSTTKEEDAVDVKKGPPNPGAIVGLSTRILGMFKSKLPAGGKAPNPAKMIALKDLTAAKSKIRSKLDSCKASQRECNFELAYSVLSPLDLKPISTQAMNKIAANTIAVISACESKYALLGEDTGIDTNAQDHREQDDLENDESHEQADIDVSDTDHNISGASTPRAEQDSSDKPHITKKKGKHHGRKHEWNEKNRSELDLVKPKREIEFGDSQLLRFLMKRIAKPYGDLQTVLDRSIDILNIFVAYSYVRFRLYSTRSRNDQLIGD